MTRIEKYKEYRDEINQSVMISANIALDDTNIARYKKSIDSINIAILNSFSDQDFFLSTSATQTSLEDKQISSHICKLFNNLNKAKNSINQDTISSLFLTIKQNSILSENNNNFKEEWFMQSPYYADLKQICSPFTDNKTLQDDINKQLQDKYNNFTAKTEKYEVKKMTEITQYSQKKSSHYVFVVSIAIAVAFFILTFILIVLKMVVK